MRPVLAWMDLEMTGLDPARHVIVEIATFVTDDDLEIVAEGPDLVVHQPPEAHGRAWTSSSATMHTRAACCTAIEASTITLEEAGRRTLEFIKEHVPEPRTVPLCGNSIGTDRRFLAAYLPEIEEHLHYRSVDVSTLKELAPALVPRGAGRGAPQGHRPPGPRRHPRVDRRAALVPRARVPSADAADRSRSGPARSGRC